jgi:hypothetical protein
VPIVFEEDEPSREPRQRRIGRRPLKSFPRLRQVVGGTRGTTPPPNRQSRRRRSGRG